ncbi:hypothetical protein [Bradyrhizobium sp. dw_78]|uniref:hypothetical protein n=1 Tax=Bradyrhizobium sp. dw_78 TaxID=2719793 RepID=UPI001BD42B22|nr:hypothetical protein [Bradyrhizobium sp. dw_78]
MTSEIVLSADAAQPLDHRESLGLHLTSDGNGLSETEIASLVQDIERDGYAVLTQYISQADLDALLRFVRDAVAAAGNRYVALSGPEPVAETVLGKMTESPTLKQLCARIYESATSRPAPDQPYYQILRCLTGDFGRKHSMNFHFDSYVLTLLLPIEVPAGNDSGELIVLPNVRSVRRWYAANLIDKVLLDNPMTQRILRAMAKLHPERFVRIPMVPANLYFFWGYRSIHTNAPCDADKIRATALFHYGDPHHDSKLKKWLRRSH